MKEGKEGVAGDALSCACEAGNGFSNDSEREGIVREDRQKILFCSGRGANGGPQVSLELCVDDWGTQKSVRGEKESVVLSAGRKSASEQSIDGAVNLV